jgi:hypothetical protein
MMELVAWGIYIVYYIIIEDVYVAQQVLATAVASCLVFFFLNYHYFFSWL